MVTASDVAIGLLGGALIGLGAALLLLFNGRVAGVVGIVSGLLLPDRGEWGWRAAFALGLLAGGGLFALVHPAAIAAAPGPLPVIALAGVAVGLGARVGGGCTAGHGVCGIGRLSRRSLVATMVFVATGMITVAAQRLSGGLP